jgi:hypothetical protein
MSNDRLAGPQVYSHTADNTSESRQAEGEIVFRMGVGQVIDVVAGRQDTVKDDVSGGREPEAALRRRGKRCEHAANLVDELAGRE